MATVNGTSGNDSLNGTTANDTLNGLGGNDTLNGSAGTDFYDGGAGLDSIDFRQGTSALVVDFTTSSVSGAYNGTFTSIERAVGGNGNDSLLGAAGNQELSGRAGDDTLAGGAGNDSLYGGNGLDQFIFREVGAANADLLGDFSSTSDKIVLDGAVMTALGASGNFSATDARFWSSSSGTAHDADDRIIYNTTTRQLFYDADGNGSGAAQLIATLQSGATLTAANIVAVGSPSSTTTTPDSPGVVSSFPDSADAEINALLSPLNFKWGTGGVGTGATLTYSFRTDSSRYNDSAYPAGSEPREPGWAPFTESQREAIRDALATFAEITNLEFIEVTDSNSVAGDIRFGNTTNLDGFAGWAYYPAMSIQAGDVWFINSVWSPDPATDEPGTSAYNLALHEIGHSLGLKHPFESPTLPDSSRENWDYTVMSYSGGGSGFPEGPMLLDIAALQYLYGANMSTGAGNDVYSWGIGEPIYQTLWDAGGIDTLDWSNQSTAARFNLNAGVWNDIGAHRGFDTPDNLMIAYNVVIENANGGSAADWLIGNAVGNSLAGGGGDDLLDGGLANDILIGGAGADGFQLSQLGGGNADQVTDFISGLDTLWLDASAMPALGPAGSLSASDARFWASFSGTAHDADDRVIYNTVTRQLWYDADGNAPGTAQLLATLQTGATVAATDIVVVGTSQGSTLNGTAGNDSLVGGGGNDTINALGGNDTLRGLEGDDSLVGGSGNDLLDSGPGSDEFGDIGEGEDTLVGGLGDDTYLVGGREDQIVDEGGVDAVIGERFGTMDPGIENLTLQGVWDHGVIWPEVTGNDLDNVITNSTGNFALLGGGGGDDTLIGGSAADQFIFGPNYGNDVVDGGGDDFDGLDFQNASAGVVIDFTAGTVTGGGGTVAFTGITQAIGSAFNDRLVGDGSAPSLFGYLGDDTLIGSDGDDRLNGDGIWADHDASEPGGNDQLLGGAGNDTLQGREGDDLLDGGTGDDTFLLFTDFGSHGNDSVLGGDGVDSVVIGSGASSGSNAVVDLQAGTLDMGSGSGTISGIENVTMHSGPARIVGTAGNNNLQGGNGNDTVEGGGGDDTLYGDQLSNAGSTVPYNDEVHGGDGNDLLVGGWANDFLQGGAGNDTLRGGLTPEDRVVISSNMDANDTIDGGAGNDVLEGDIGADDFLFTVASGSANADQILDFVSGTDDVVVDGNVHANIGPSGDLVVGDDRFFAGAGASSAQDAEDRFVYNTSTGQLWYDADGLGGSAAQLIATLQGTPSLAATDITVINGSSGGGNVVNGTAGNDSLNGTGSNDTLNGLGGNDTLNGSAGTDFYDGGTGFDSVDFRFATSAVTVNFASSSVSGFYTGTFANTERAVGGNGNDSLLGAAGNQEFSGRAGNDALAGGAGVDTLYGGNGLDDFVFREMGSTNADRLFDFAPGSDDIALDDSAFTAIGGLGDFAAGDARFWASSSGVAHDANDRVIYNTSNGNLFYDADGNGGGAAQLVATLANLAALSATDITVI